MALAAEWKTCYSGGAEHQPLSGPWLEAAASRRRFAQSLRIRCAQAAAHLERRGTGQEPEACLRRLLGKVSYVLQINPDDREMQEYRQWLCRELQKSGQE